jgi:hypothetical protein
MVATTARQITAGAQPKVDDSLVRIIRSEFREMPGMHLTRAQFRRLWDLTNADCECLLKQLVGSGFLEESRDGEFGLPDDF